MQKTLIAVLALIAIASVAAVADALVLTDEERLESFAELFDGQVEQGRIDEALSYIDTERQPVTAHVLGQRLEFDAGEDADIDAMVRRELRDIIGAEVSLRSHTVRVQQQRAQVAMRLQGSGELVDLTFDLEKYGDRFFVRQVRVQ